MKLTAAVAALLLSLMAVACEDGDPARPGAGDDSVSDRRTSSTGGGDDRASGGTSADPSAPTSPSTPSSPAGPVFTTIAEQVAAGEQTFESTCTRCHGSDGSGGRGPRLIGRSEGALDSFTNAEEVAAYVTSNMPVASKGEAYAVVAYLMRENGVNVGERVLDETVAKGIELH